jgi:hypothetical protein
MHRIKPKSTDSASAEASAGTFADMGNEQSVRERVIRILNSRGRLSDHVGEQSDEGVQADLTNLRAAVGELQESVVLLAEELDRLR